MRRALDALYACAAFVAAASLVTIALLVLAQVGLRALGSQLPSADDFAGFALVATTIVGLAPAYRRNAHIRVGLLIERFPLGYPVRRALERGVTAVSALLVGWAAWHTIRFVHESYVYNEINQGLVAVKLWYPQSLMAFGLLVFFVALLDDLVTDLAGGTQSHLAAHAGDAMPVEK
ncbi:TRAP transporter small permease [Rhabdaerophilum calidifontis]|uniref:TRAP transporter small permease n=1 Tax=Rhabdaerophilum calidifontis TaxID=2604328 RepID=UPI00123A85A0|nr:TRAP transporter small permease [Rhabdaerophilum calidifontis]